MPYPVFFSNLPPNATVEEIRTECQKYGPVINISINADYYRDIYYPFDSAYVNFEDKRSIMFFQEDDIDIVIRGYFVELASVTDSPLPFSTATILGIGDGITEAQILSALRLSDSIKIKMIRPGSPHNDGYALISFENNVEYIKFLESNKEFTIDDCLMAIRPYPKEQIRFVSLCTSSLSFQVLRKMPRFQDFTIHFNEKVYTCSSKVISASSNVVKKQLKIYPPVHEITLVGKDGNIEEIINALYGYQIALTYENCEFVHSIASQLDVQDLIQNSGLLCYDLLTLDNVSDIAHHLAENHLNMDYIVDFVASYLKEITESEQYSSIMIELPSETVLKVARHPVFKMITESEAYQLFHNAILLQKIKKSDISCIDNKDLDVNYNRQLLIGYLNQNNNQPMTVQDLNIQAEPEQNPTRITPQYTTDDDTATLFRSVLESNSQVFDDESYSYSSSVD